MKRPTILILKFSAIIFPIFAALCVILIFVFSATCPRLEFSATFYFVCYQSKKDEHAASSISSVVQNLGGAGYVIESGGNYYVTVSCYYSSTDAEAVRAVLLKKGTECTTVKCSVDGYDLKGNAAKNKEKYLGNLNTLYSLSRVLYQAANSQDKGEMGQSEIKGVLSDVKSALSALSRENAGNCFSREITNLLAECEDAAGGYTLSRDVRRLQIAIADSILHIRLY